MPTQADVPVEPPVDDGRQIEQPGVNAADYAPPEPRAPEPKDNELTIASADRLDAIYENARKQREIDEKPEGEAPAQDAQAEPPQATSQHQDHQPRYRVKVDGQEMDVSVDDLVRSYQIDQAAHRRMQEASTMRAQAKHSLRWPSAASRSLPPRMAPPLNPVLPLLPIPLSALPLRWASPSRT